MVLRNIKYSKFEISRLCQRWVILEDLKSWRGVAKEIRLQKKAQNYTNKQGSSPARHLLSFTLIIVDLACSANGL